jgi:hypothetical protein
MWAGASFLERFRSGGGFAVLPDHVDKQVRTDLAGDIHCRAECQFGSQRHILPLEIALLPPFVIPHPAHAVSETVGFCQAFLPGIHIDTALRQVPVKIQGFAANLQIERQFIGILMPRMKRNAGGLELRDNQTPLAEAFDVDRLTRMIASTALRFLQLGN